MNFKIFQIFYDEETKKKIDPHFLQFDNSKVKDTWYEYSVIRNIFLREKFNDNTYLGFFSPKFFEKTGMSGKDVVDVISNLSSDIISFSSRFSRIALFQNSFLQGEFYHPGLVTLAQKLFSKLKIFIELNQLYQDKSRIIYSNFFVAKYSFWKLYFEISEKIYKIANDKNSEIYNQINSYTIHRIKDVYQFKVFIMERLVSIILEKYSIDASIGLDFNKYLSNNPYEKVFFNIFQELDNLKSKFLKTKKIEFINLYKNLREETLKSFKL